MVLLFWLCMVASAFAGDMTITWDANTEADLGGYKLYIGTASRNYTETIDVGNVTQYKTSRPGGKTYYVAATAYDKTGNESGLSNEAFKAMPIDVPDAIVTKVVTDATGATVTILGTAMALRYNDDFTQSTVIPNYTPGATTFRLNKLWPIGTTFVCFQAQKQNDVWTEQGCNSVTPSVPPPPPPPPLKQCADGKDNDGDGKTDLADPGCLDANDDDETDPPPPVDLPPDPPKGIILSDRPTASEVILAWQPAARATNYAIKRLDTTNGKLIVVKSGITTLTGRVPLATSGRRLFVVCAVNLKGEACPTPLHGLFVTR